MDSDQPLLTNLDYEYTARTSRRVVLLPLGPSPGSHREVSRSGA